MKLNFLYALILILSLIFGGYIYAKPQQKEMLTVDVSQLINKMMKNLVNQELSQDDLKTKTSEALQQLDALLNKIAIERKAIILTDKAVVAGVTDITQEVSDILSEAL